MQKLSGAENPTTDQTHNTVNKHELEGKWGEGKENPPQERGFGFSFQGIIFVGECGKGTATSTQEHNQ